MDRSEAKRKVAVLVSNYVKVPRGKKLPSGTVDRLVDRLLADEYAARDLAELDPNSDFSAASFVRRYVDLFRGVANRRPTPAESLSAETSRRVNAAIVAARDRYVATLVGSAGGLPDPEPSLSPEEEAKVAERALELVADADGETTVGYLFRQIRFELSLSGKLGTYGAFGALLARLGFSVAGEGADAKVEL